MVQSNRSNIAVGSKHSAFPHGTSLYQAMGKEYEISTGVAE